MQAVLKGVRVMSSTYPGVLHFSDRGHPLTRDLPHPDRQERDSSVDVKRGGSTPDNLERGGFLALVPVRGVHATRGSSEYVVITPDVKPCLFVAEL